MGPFASERGYTRRCGAFFKPLLVGLPGGNWKYILFVHTRVYTRWDPSGPSVRKPVAVARVSKRFLWVLAPKFSNNAPKMLQKMTSSACHSAISCQYAAPRGHFPFQYTAPPLLVRPKGGLPAAPTAPRTQTVVPQGCGAAETGEGGGLQGGSAQKLWGLRTWSLLSAQGCAHGRCRGSQRGGYEPGQQAGRRLRPPRTERWGTVLGDIEGDGSSAAACKASCDALTSPWPCAAAQFGTTSGRCQLMPSSPLFVYAKVRAGGVVVASPGPSPPLRTSEHPGRSKFLAGVLEPQKLCISLRPPSTRQLLDDDREFARRFGRCVVLHSGFQGPCQRLMRSTTQID
eukprot:gene6066-biopygen7282